MKAQNDDTGYLNMDNAFSIALEMLKDKDVPRDKVYVWRQRYKEGKLSQKKVDEILAQAGFKPVVEPKYIHLDLPSEYLEDDD